MKEKTIPEDADVLNMRLPEGMNKIVEVVFEAEDAFEKDIAFGIDDACENDVAYEKKDICININKIKE